MHVKLFICIIVKKSCIFLTGITLRQGAQMKGWKLKTGKLYSETMRMTAEVPVKKRRETGTDPGAVIETGAGSVTETGTITANPLATACGAADTDTGTITLTRYDHCLPLVAMATVCFLCLLSCYLHCGSSSFPVLSEWMTGRMLDEIIMLILWHKKRVLTQDITLVWYPQHIKWFKAPHSWRGNKNLECFSMMNCYNCLLNGLRKYLIWKYVAIVFLL